MTISLHDRAQAAFNHGVGNPSIIHSIMVRIKAGMKPADILVYCGPTPRIWGYARVMPRVDAESLIACEEYLGERTGISVDQLEAADEYLDRICAVAEVSK